MWYIARASHKYIFKERDGKNGWKYYYDRVKSAKDRATKKVEDIASSVTKTKKKLGVKELINYNKAKKNYDKAKKKEEKRTSSDSPTNYKNSKMFQGLQKWYQKKADTINKHWVENKEQSDYYNKVLELKDKPVNDRKQDQARFNMNRQLDREFAKKEDKFIKDQHRKDMNVRSHVRAREMTMSKAREAYEGTIIGSIFKPKDLGKKFSEFTTNAKKYLYRPSMFKVASKTFPTAPKRHTSRTPITSDPTIRYKKETTPPPKKKKKKITKDPLLKYNTSYKKNKTKTIKRSAKGTQWENHKYKDIVNGRYIYDEEADRKANGGKSKFDAIREKNKDKDWHDVIYEHVENMIKDNPKLNTDMIASAPIEDFANTLKALTSMNVDEMTMGELENMRKEIVAHYAGVDVNKEDKSGNKSNKEQGDVTSKSGNSSASSKSNTSDTKEEDNKVVDNDPLKHHNVGTSYKSGKEPENTIKGSKRSTYKDGDKDFDDANYDEKNRLGNTDFFLHTRKDGSKVILEEDTKWEIGHNVDKDDLIKNLEAFGKDLDNRKKNGEKYTANDWDKWASEAINKTKKRGNK